MNELSSPEKKAICRAYNTLDEEGYHAAQILMLLDESGLTIIKKPSVSIAGFAAELRKWWSFDDRQMHTHSWHSREDFIERKLPELLTTLAAVKP
jgi:hypothetical protein